MAHSVCYISLCKVIVFVGASNCSSLHRWPRKSLIWHSVMKKQPGPSSMWVYCCILITRSSFWQRVNRITTCLRSMSAYSEEDSCLHLSLVFSTRLACLCFLAPSALPHWKMDDKYGQAYISVCAMVNNHKGQGADWQVKHQMKPTPHLWNTHQILYTRV